MSVIECGVCGQPAHDGYICHGCTAALAGVLRAIPDLIEQLTITITQQARVTAGGTGTRQVVDRIGETEACALLGCDALSLAAWIASVTGRQPVADRGTRWHLLADVARYADAQGHTRVAKAVRHQRLTAAENRSPMHVGASDALTALRAAVHGWARCLAEDTGATPGGDPWLWLADNVASMRAREWAAEAAREIREAVDRGWRVVDRPAEQVYVGLCPGGETPCGVELWARPGAASVACRACGQSWDVGDARAAMLRSAEDRLLPAGDIACALSTGREQVSAAMVRKWAWTDQRRHERGGPVGFRSVGVDGAGRPLYRLGDAMERRLTAVGAAVGTPA